LCAFAPLGLLPLRMHRMRAGLGPIFLRGRWHRRFGEGTGNDEQGRRDERMDAGFHGGLGFKDGNTANPFIRNAAASPELSDFSFFLNP
jgi:hypothetical protein